MWVNAERLLLFGGERAAALRTMRSSGASCYTAGTNCALQP